MSFYILFVSLHIKKKNNMNKLSISDLNNWFNKLSNKNKVIALLVNDYDKEELDEMSFDELLSEIGFNDINDVIYEWNNFTNFDKFYNWLEYNNISYDKKHLISFIDTNDINNFSMLSIGELEDILSIESNKRGFYKKEWLIDKLKEKGEI